jgi:hypothetical protein
MIGIYKSPADFRSTLMQSGTNHADGPTDIPMRKDPMGEDSKNLVTGTVLHEKSCKACIVAASPPDVSTVLKIKT